MSDIVDVSDFVRGIIDDVIDDVITRVEQRAAEVQPSRPNETEMCSTPPSRCPVTALPMNGMHISATD